MPTLEFKGKHIVYAHHLNVPYRLLDVDRKKSLLPKESDGKDGNLIIHGDNLHALKALLPRYGGKVNCVYIDPPYNTGNEGWCYNDNVNSELMQRWLKERREVDRVVDREDEERHDKWLCMMWPRLQLLHELLAEDGVIFVSIDDNEVHNLRAIMDQIFGEDNFRNCVILRRGAKNVQTQFDKIDRLNVGHEYVLAYSKSPEHRFDALLDALPKTRPGGWNNHWRSTDRGTMRYTLFGISPQQGQWRWGKEGSQQAIANYQQMLKELERNDDNITGEEIDAWYLGQPDPKPKLLRLSRTGKPEHFVPPSDTRHISSMWDMIANSGAGFKKIMPDDSFDTPKSAEVIKRIIRFGCGENKNAVVLDSFAGSGTTAQAVLELNKEDGGDRKFILVECEDYADSLTAERVRRVIKGVKTAKNETVKNGFGGHFAFCSLGKAIELEALLRGQVLPSYEQMARYAAYVATGAVIDKIKAEPGRDYFFGAHGGYRFHLIYRPDKAFLRGRDSALRFDVAEAISAAARKAGKTALVFAPWKFMSQKDLSAIKVVFCQIPHEVLRLADDADSE